MHRHCSVDVSKGSGNDQEEIQTKDRQGSRDDCVCSDRIQTTGIDHKQRRKICARPLKNGKKKSANRQEMKADWKAKNMEKSEVENLEEKKERKIKFFNLFRKC